MLVGDNPVVWFLNKMTDLLVLNFIFLICCIPVVTIGPAITAMYYVNMRSIRYGDGYVLRTFFSSFKRNFWQALAAWLMTLAVAGLFLVDILFWLQNDFGALSTVMAAVSSFFAFLCFVVVIWIFPVIAKMENRFLIQVKNAAALAVAHFFPYTLVCTLLIFGAFYAAYVSLAADVLFLLIGFSLLSYILSFFLYKVFAKYLKEEPVGENDPLYGTENGIY